MLEFIWKVVHVRAVDTGRQIMWFIVQQIMRVRLRIQLLLRDERLNKVQRTDDEGLSIVMKKPGRKPDGLQRTGDDHVRSCKREIGNAGVKSTDVKMRECFPQPCVS